MRPEAPLPALRADVDIATDPAAAGRRYLLRDRSSGRIWQMGERESSVLPFLDGTRSLADVRNALGREGPTDPDELSGFVRQLSREGLLAGRYDGPRRRGLGAQVARRILTFPVRFLLRWLVVLPWDLLSVGGRRDVLQPRHLRLGRPDRLLAALMRVARPLLGRAGFTAAVMWAALGFVLLAGHFDAWWTGVQALWTPWGAGVVVLVGVLAVHLPHQLAH